MIRKITFVYPDHENLGIEYLMAICIKGGIDVAFIGYEAENSYFNKKVRVSLLNTARQIASTKADIVAFSCVTDNFHYQLECAKLLKDIDPTVATIFGGIHITALPEKALEEDCIDSIAIGESDISLLEFLKKCKVLDGKIKFPKENIDGIVFKDGNILIGEFKEGPLVDLNMLPFPYKKPFFKNDHEVGREYRIISSRGCPYSCTYCFNSFIHNMRNKKIIKQRTVQNVIEELKWAKKKYSVKKVFFVDDSFTTNKKWINIFVKEYKKEINLPFACIANPDYIDMEVAELLKYAGCKFIQIGVQSISKSIARKTLKRPATKGKISQAITVLKKAGMMVQVDHMLGIPGDNVENQIESLIYYNNLRPNLISVFWLTYYPKTEIINHAIKYNILSDKDVEKIENASGITETSLHNGGSMRDPSLYYGIHLVFNYLPLIPKNIVDVIIGKQIYRYFTIKNYYLSTALPRVILSILDKRYFVGRNLLIKFISETTHKLIKAK